MRLDDLVADLDEYFRVRDVENDDWGPTYDALYPEPYWREFAEPAYERRWNGLLVRGSSEVRQARTCVFPSDAIVAAVEPESLLFSEHPIAFEDDVEGFAPLARETFERLKAEGIGFYHVHAPLDMHPDVSRSRLVAEGFGRRRRRRHPHCVARARLRDVRDRQRGPFAPWPTSPGGRRRRDALRTGEAAPARHGRLVRAARAARRVQARPAGAGRLRNVHLRPTGTKPSRA